MITFYTNKGKTADQWSMDVQAPNGYDCYSFSNMPEQPDGINTFNGTIKDPSHGDDYQILWDDLPEKVQRAIVNRLTAIPL